MTKISGLSIPVGLENLYNTVFSIVKDGTVAVYRYSPSKGDTVKKASRNNRSLFLLWQSLYDSFTSDRKDAWTAYWITLPFGAHSGGNGWPGSGYSAFVYVNAPRRKAGLDLLLDPPVLVYYDFVAGIDTALAEYTDSQMGWQHFSADITAPSDHGDSPGVGIENLGSSLQIKNVSLIEISPDSSDELVTNGDFAAGLDAWEVLARHVTVASGVATMESDAVLTQYIALTTDWVYRLQFDYLGS